MTLFIHTIRFGKSIKILYSLLLIISTSTAVLSIKFDLHEGEITGLVEYRWFLSS